MVCEDCSIVVAEGLIEQPPEPAADHETGNDNRLLPQLFYSNRDSEGKLVPSEKVWKLRQTSQTFNLKSAERAMLNFESKLRSLAQKRGLSDEVVQRATDMHHRIRERKVFNKPNHTELALALLLTACREDSLRVFTLEDMVGDSGASLNKMKKYHYKIARALGVEIREKTTVDGYIYYYAAKFGRHSDGALIREAMRIALGSISANPTRHCVAAAALYIAMKQVINISQKQFCDTVKLSEISLRDWVNKLGKDIDAQEHSGADIRLDGVRDE